MRTWLNVRVKEAKPTLNHRPAVWECLLGTVYAMNQEGVIRYFDYDWKAALEYAGYDESKDPRLAKNQRRVSWTGRQNDDPSYNQLVLWLKD